MVNTSELKDNFFTQAYVSSEARFFTINDIQEMTGWSENTVKKLFNDPKFPSADYGRTPVIEVHALIDYFSKRHEKKLDSYWR